MTDYRKGGSFGEAGAPAADVVMSACVCVCVCRCCLVLVCHLCCPSNATFTCGISESVSLQAFTASP